MLQGGEDPMFVARRLVIFASEDVGSADPTSLSLATAALAATEKVGMPECQIVLAHVTRHCAEAPKSRQAIDDIKAMNQRIQDSGTPSIPEHLLNREKRITDY
jgi:putative ATPase